MLEIRLASASGVGARDHNEDDLRCGTADGMAYAVLSDGAGGHDKGAIAADVVVRCVTVALQSATEMAPATLHAAVHQAQDLLLQIQRRDRDTDQLRATLVALWIDARRGLAVWSHVGDSRLYLLRDRHIQHVTRDDTVVQRLLDAGLITADAALTHPMKHHLACAMGVGEGFDAHTLERPFALQPGDALLLCSDGWWDSTGGELIERSYGCCDGPQPWLDTMVRHIRQADRPRQDNYSAVAVCIGAA